MYLITKKICLKPLGMHKLNDWEGGISPLINDMRVITTWVWGYGWAVMEMCGREWIRMFSDCLSLPGSL